MTARDPHLDAFTECARRLNLQWERVAAQWRDRVQEEFARAHHQPLLHEHQRMTDAAATLVAALQATQRSVR